MDSVSGRELIITHRTPEWLQPPLPVAPPSAVNASIGKDTGSPFMTRDRWAACNTFSTRKPLRLSVRGGALVSIADKKA
jgi:hypothetical protein